MATSTFQNNRSTFLNKFSKLSSNSSEWARIEYNVQLSLGSIAAKIKNIWSVASGHNTYNFEKNNKNLLTIDCWLETRLLDENNRLEKVCQKGFEFPSNGLLFPTGQIKLAEGTFGKNKIYEFMLLKIAVGKSYCLPGKTTIKEKYKLPFGFNSIYLYNENQEEETEIFKHDYILFENSQVLPRYIIHFEIDSSKEEILSGSLCELCNESKANIYCRADDIGLCYECDEEHHLKGGKLVSRHIRVPIGEKPKNFGSCLQHSENQLELYCNVCNIPLCVYCKINGSHSVGEPSTHTVVKISDAYSKAISESKELDPLLEKRKNQLQELLSEIDLRIKEINKNASYIEEKIYQMLQEALMQLQEETQKKMTCLIGDQLEVKRQYEQIQWLESFLKYQQELLQPSDYLNNWGRHIVLRNEILSLSNIPIVTNVQPDLKLEGKIKVISENHFKQEGEFIQDKYDKVFTNEKEKPSLSNDEFKPSSKIRSNIFSKHFITEKNDKIINSKYSSKFNQENENPRFDINAKSEIFKPESISKEKGGSPSVASKVFMSGLASKQANIEEDEEEDDYQMNLKSPSNPLFQSNPIEFSNNLKMDENIAISYLRTKLNERAMSKLVKNSFKNSEILSEKEAQTLVYNIMLVKEQLIETKLIFHLGRDKSFANLQKAFQNFKYSNVIIVSFGGERFGGYASEPWDLQKQKSFGDSTCFLFNLKKDAKILPISGSNYQFQNKNSFGFGFRDLAFENDFEKCETELENAYSCNLNKGTNEPRTFLAGSPNFKPEILEIWAIIPLPPNYYDE